MKHSDSHVVTVTQLKAAVNNLIYFFNNIAVPAHIKNGQSFPFSQDVFSDKLLKHKIGVLSGVATLYKVPSIKESGQQLTQAPPEGNFAIMGGLTIQNTRFGTANFDFSVSAPINPKIGFSWGAYGVAYVPNAKPKIPFSHVTIVMRMGKNNIVKSIVKSTVAGSA